MLNIAVLISGNGTNLQALIDAVEAGKINGKIVAVVSNKQEAYGLERAKQHGIPTAVFQKKGNPNFDHEIVAYLKSMDVQLVVLAGFLCILGNEFLTEYKDRIMNVHPSLIPSFCGDGFYGLKVHEAALARGVKVTGATVHFVNEITDGGKIISQRAVEILEGDTPETLQKRVMEQAEWPLLTKAVEMFCNGEI